VQHGGEILTARERGPFRSLDQMKLRGKQAFERGGVTGLLCDNPAPFQRLELRASLLISSASNLRKGQQRRDGHE